MGVCIVNDSELHISLLNNVFTSSPLLINARITSTSCVGSTKHVALFVYPNSICTLLQTPLWELWPVLPSVQRGVHESARLAYPILHKAKKCSMK
jgi:hypothetical protein